jgi:transposase-like protein
MKKTAKKGAMRQEENSHQLAIAAFQQARETLHGAVVSAGMAVLAALLEEDRTALCGARYSHDGDRQATRHGYTGSELAMGGRLVSVKRPRVRGKNGAELKLPTWERFANADPLTPRAVEQMVLGVATRKYDRSIEPAPAGVASRGTSKSAVSRRFVRETRSKLDDALNRDLSGLDLAALVIDGLNVGEHVVLIAIGIDASGQKHVLSLHEGATENATACKALLEGMVSRGLRTERSVLVVIDGSKALYAAVRAVLGDRALIQRCQVHKRRNVLDHLPDHMHKQVGATISAAYRATNAERAEKILQGLARQLERDHPSAAASLREGLAETLTVVRMALMPALMRTLATTNSIEHINGRIRKTCKNVDRWKGGSMVLRWVATALDEARKTFRRLRGHEGMPKLVAALRAHDRKLSSRVDEVTKAA